MPEENNFSELAQSLAAKLQADKQQDLAPIAKGNRYLRLKRLWGDAISAANYGLPRAEADKLFSELGSRLVEDGHDTRLLGVVKKILASSDSPSEACKRLYAARLLQLACDSQAALGTVGERLEEVSGIPLGEAFEFVQRALSNGGKDA